jgi:hypothetical protein
MQAEPEKIQPLPLPNLSADGSILPKPTIKINFSDFWGHFDKRDNYFWHLLSGPFNLVLSSEPDFVIYSAYGRDFTQYDCFRIFYTGENVRPDFRECDFAFSFDYIDSARHYRLPLYALYADNELLTRKQVDPEELLRRKAKFCNFVVSNPGCVKRNDFFMKLSRYKNVDSAGLVMNNIGRYLGPNPADKWEFLRSYKFSIAFENASHPGYTTEKIFEPMMADSLPIYWGNPLIHRDFNTRSFLNYHDFPNEKALIERIVELDRDDNLYLEYMSEPWFPGNVLNPFVDPQNVIRQFEFIFSHLDRSLPVARTALRLYTASKDVAIWSRRKVASAKLRISKVAEALSTARL